MSKVTGYLRPRVTTSTDVRERDLQVLTASSFNSYTHEICVDNAVVGITSREDSQAIVAGTTLPVVKPPVENAQPVADSDVPKIDPPGGDKPADTAAGSISTVPKNVDILDTFSETVRRYPRQIVTFTSRYINKLSDVASTLNVSGSLAIKYGEVSGGGSGSYVSQSSTPSHY